MADRISTLTAREKEVLRHVHALKTSSQIAYVLQIAEVSVNKRIDSARRKLGGISRRQAALLLAEEEGMIISYPKEYC
jgi:DNA-binding CsgD family transcriptional regulator